MYPFPTIWTLDTWVHGLYSCLQPWQDIVSYLDTYIARVETFAWPHLAQEVTKKEVERFMADFAYNAENYPDMLALMFAALATGVQRGIHERSGSQWVAGAVEQERLKGDVFGGYCEVLRKMRADSHSLRMHASTSPFIILESTNVVECSGTHHARSISDEQWTIF